MVTDECFSELSFYEGRRLFREIKADVQDNARLWYNTDEVVDNNILDSDLKLNVTNTVNDNMHPSLLGQGQMKGKGEGQRQGNNTLRSRDHREEQHSGKTKSWRKGLRLRPLDNFKILMEAIIR